MRGPNQSDLLLAFPVMNMIGVQLLDPRGAFLGTIPVQP